MRQSASVLSAEREQKLRQLGDAVGHVLFPQEVEKAFRDLLAEAHARSEAIDLVVEDPSQSR